MPRSDRDCAVSIAEKAKTYAQILLVLACCASQTSYRQMRRLCNDPKELVASDKLAPGEVVGLHKRIMKCQPAGKDRRNAAVEAISESKQSQRACAILAALISLKSPFQIHAVEAIGSYKVAEPTIQEQELANETPEEKAAREYEKKYGCVVHSTRLSLEQRMAGLAALKRIKTVAYRCEVLMACIHHSEPDEIFAAHKKARVTKDLGASTKRCSCGRRLKGHQCGRSIAWSY